MTAFAFLVLLASPASPPPAQGATQAPSLPVAEGSTWDEISRDQYQPQAGDILLFNTPSLVGDVLCHLILCGGTTHSAIVVVRPDGPLVLLETPHVGSPVTLMDLRLRLRTYDGSICVRRRHRPLTAKESAKLTTFAFVQAGKPYDYWGLFVMPFRCPVRIFKGQPLTEEDLNDSSWFCSSLVVAACAAADLLDRTVVKPTCTRPSDLCSDLILDLSQGWAKPFHLADLPRKPAH